MVCGSAVFVGVPIAAAPATDGTAYCGEDEKLLASNPTKFEGPEKKLEIVLFEPLPQIRSNQDGRWHRVIAPCQAAILSSLSCTQMDAYLLSESSLFVWSDRILIITCGQTTLLQAVPEILNFVGPENIAFVFYERKSFMFPNEQPSDFENDVAYMLRYFPGHSYRLGPANSDHVHVFYSACGKTRPAPDVTLQVLMHDIGPQAVHTCISAADRPQQDLGQKMGFDALFGAMETDSYTFSPYGYSFNGVRDAHYVTVHVTPNPEGSYASFETNMPVAAATPFAQKIVSLFQPGRFSLVVTASVNDDERIVFNPSFTHLHPAYRSIEKTIYLFEYGYAMTFANFKKR